MSREISAPHAFAVLIPSYSPDRERAFPAAEPCAALVFAFLGNEDESHNFRRRETAQKESI